MFLWQSIPGHGWVPNESGMLVGACSRDDLSGVAARQLQTIAGPLIQGSPGPPHHHQVGVGDDSRSNKLLANKIMQNMCPYTKNIANTHRLHDVLLFLKHR